MALMNKPLPDDVTDTDVAVPLAEDGDVEAENLSYSGAVAFIKGHHHGYRAADVHKPLGFVTAVVCGG